MSSVKLNVLKNHVYIFKRQGNLWNLQDFLPVMKAEKK